MGYQSAVEIRPAVSGAGTSWLAGPTLTSDVGIPFPRRTRCWFEDVFALEEARKANALQTCCAGGDEQFPQLRVWRSLLLCTPSTISKWIPASKSNLQHRQQHNKRSALTMAMVAQPLCASNCVNLRQQMWTRGQRGFQLPFKPDHGRLFGWLTQCRGAHSLAV